MGQAINWDNVWIDSKWVETSHELHRPPLANIASRRTDTWTDPTGTLVTLVYNTQRPHVVDRAHVNGLRLTIDYALDLLEAKTGASTPTATITETHPTSEAGERWLDMLDQQGWRVVGSECTYTTADRCRVTATIRRTGD